MAFKMRRSPVKGKLSNFFSNLGNQLKRNRRDIGGEFKGIKQKDKARILKNRADAAYYGSAEDKAKNSEANRVKPTAADKSKPKTKGPDWKKAPKVGTKARTDWYKKHNLKLDDTTPGNKSKRDVGASGAFQGDPEKDNFGATSRVPLTKKSPSKKRGYKMNRKK